MPTRQTGEAGDPERLGSRDAKADVGNAVEDTASVDEIDWRASGGQNRNRRD